MSSDSSLPVASTKLQNLRQFYHQLKQNFHQTHGQASDWLQDRAVGLENFRTASQHILAVTSLAGVVALNSKPVDAQVTDRIKAMEAEHKDEILAKVSLEEQQAIMEKMKSYVQMPPGHLAKEDELYLEQQLSDLLGFEVVAELDGHRLNHTLGVMGGEQHLKRFPADSLNQHESVHEAGLAPNRGAFGWFTESGQLTPLAIQRERYYFAVQTLYLPDWNSNYTELKSWYKFRKMIVINPQEQMAVVGVVGDAGPALWVKKQFGGSPEVIREGKIWSPKAKGRVLLFFVDDPNNEVPLGPIDLTKSLMERLSLLKPNS